MHFIVYTKIVAPPTAHFSPMRHHIQPRLRSLVYGDLPIRMAARPATKWTVYAYTVKVICLCQRKPCMLVPVHGVEEWSELSHVSGVVAFAKRLP